MKILIVCSGNSRYVISPFIKEQVESLKKFGIIIDYFLIKGYGVFGYLKNLPKLNKQIKKGKYDLIHAHYGLSGLLANLQRKISVITTFHGLDICRKSNKMLSWVSSLLSIANIFVVDKIQFKFITNNKYIIPCGVNLELFKPLDPTSLKIKYKFSSKKRYILFSSRFNNEVKNWILATQAIDSLNSNNIEVIELDGYSRLEVVELMNICDMALLTSVSEGSPQFIKEAMACNIPIVSTDVGDVKKVLGDTEGCYITSFDPQDVADNIQKALDFGKRTKGRERIIQLGLDSDTIVKKIIEIYKKMI